MSTYRFTLVINHLEMDVLSDALERYIAHCDKQLSPEKKAVYESRKAKAESILRRRFDNAKLYSTNSFNMKDEASED